MKVIGGQPTDASNQGAIGDNFLAKRGHWVSDPKNEGRKV